HARVGVAGCAGEVPRRPSSRHEPEVGLLREVDPDPAHHLAGSLEVPALRVDEHAIVIPEKERSLRNHITSVTAISLFTRTRQRSSTQSSVFLWDEQSTWIRRPLYAPSSVPVEPPE